MPKNPEKKPRVKKPPATEVEEIGDDLGNAIALETLHASEGGQLLVESLVMDIISAIELLCMGVGTMEMPQMIAMVCKMKERIDIVRVLTSAKANREVLQGLLAEAIKKEKENPPADAGGSA